MNVIVSLPDDFAARFGTEAERDRKILEQLALHEYRAGRMDSEELGHVLGFDGRAELAAYLTTQGENSSVSDDRADQDLAGFRLALRSGNEDVRQAAAIDLVHRFRAFAADHLLGELDVQSLISEGRR